MDETRRKILVVDDSGVMLRHIKEILQSNYDICIAISGKMALKQFEEQHPDLILLDYEMPEMNGKETFEVIRKLPGGEEIPIIYLTSMDDKKTILELMLQKPAGYILKPPNRIKLIESIETALNTVNVNVLRV